MSDKETLVCGRGTVPGSEHIARKCETVNSKRNVLKSTMWNGAHKLKTFNILIYYLYTYNYNYKIINILYCTLS